MVFTHCRNSSHIFSKSGQGAFTSGEVFAFSRTAFVHSCNSSDITVKSGQRGDAVGMGVTGGGPAAGTVVTGGGPAVGTFVAGLVRGLAPNGRMVYCSLALNFTPSMLIDTEYVPGLTSNTSEQITTPPDTKGLESSFAWPSAFC